ncbi:alpha/beta fold hydrolase [Burkholderia sp. IMCC1007]|uniref:alpha/beta fold hydrolase n=1 Tax=Burkholderia sp. IMCC1007 TaxID=3004104 RepID=UPI0022B575BF|nr:alpha/beta hydrolase [Burkholderia sp. IMCC1007]
MAHSAPMPTTPTTKILAIGTFPPGTDMQRVQTILPIEARETAQLYLEGKIEQWYSLQDRAGVAFILNVTDVGEAHEMLDALPLGQAHLMTFSLLPIGPLKPLSKFTDDMAQGWDGDVTAADAFFHYYARFTRDQDYFEANMAQLKVPVKVVWGEKDIYIKKEMGIEYANRNGMKISILSGLGHFPHLQAPDQTVSEVRAAFRAADDCGTK